MKRGPLRIAALMSGGGRTVLNLQNRIEAGDVPAEIAFVVSSRLGAEGNQRCRAAGLDVRLALERDLGSMDAVHDAISRWLVEDDIDLVCLCGYLRWFRVDPPFVGRVINIHPALLPAFGGKGMYGHRVHQAVIDAGATESGCTVHFVDGRYDHGPIILRRRCPVLPEDDADALADRVFEQECIAYPEAVRLFAEDRVRLGIDGAVLIDGKPALEANASNEP